LFQEHPGRFPALHVKDMAEDGSWEDVGAGKLDFGAMFAHAEAGGVQQYLVEHDKPTDAWKSAERSYRGLTELRY
jgi:sugar phosphate isomerase/epimerase